MVCVKSSRPRSYNQSSSNQVIATALLVACMVVAGSVAAEAQRDSHPGCPPPQWTVTRLDALKRDGFKLPDSVERRELALALPACLGHPNPSIRDGIAFEALTAWMRAGQLDQATLTSHIGPASPIGLRGRLSSSRSETCTPSPSGSRSLARSPTRSRCHHGGPRLRPSWASKSAITCARFS